MSAWIRNGGGGNVVGVPTNGRMTVDLAAERHEMIYEGGSGAEKSFLRCGNARRRLGCGGESLRAACGAGCDTGGIPSASYGNARRIECESSGCYGPSSNEGIGDNVADLGLEFDPNTSGPGMHVTYVLPRGAGDYAETKIQEGEWVLKIDGTDVSPSMNYLVASGRRIRADDRPHCGIGSSGREFREVAIGPASGRWRRFASYFLVYGETPRVGG